MKKHGVFEFEGERLVEVYRNIVKIRRFEEKVYDLFGQNLIPGTLHLYIGEEAVAAGVCGTLRRDDYVQSTHRGHGHCIAKGADLNRMMAELFGKRTGYCKGKGGSMHITDFDVGILGATGVVGSGLPLAVGAALSCKMRKTDQAVVCFFGDGASNQGTFHESLNMAGLWKLPVIFVCENNLYAMGTHARKALAIEHVAERAAGYGMPGEVVDGNDGVEVYKAARTAVERARRGEGPSLLECKTYRHKGHSRFDAAAYRPKPEVEHWMKRDPIAVTRERLKTMNVLTDEHAKKIEDEITRLVEECARFAVESPLPDPAEALEDVFFEGRQN